MPLLRHEAGKKRLIGCVCTIGAARDAECGDVHACTCWGFFLAL